MSSVALPTDTHNSNLCEPRVPGTLARTLPAHQNSGVPPFCVLHPFEPVIWPRKNFCFSSMQSRSAKSLGLFDFLLSYWHTLGLVNIPRGGWTFPWKKVAKINAIYTQHKFKTLAHKINTLSNLVPLLDISCSPDDQLRMCLGSFGTFVTPKRLGQAQC
jgi:hypothetical protein